MDIDTFKQRLEEAKKKRKETIDSLHAHLDEISNQLEEMADMMDACFIIQNELDGNSDLTQ